MNYFKMLGWLLLSTLLFATAQAGVPLWSFVALTSTTATLPSNSSLIAQYRVTNNDTGRSLAMKSIPGVTQLTTGPGVCPNPFYLDKGQSCTLSLFINGSQVTAPISKGPVVCNNGNSNQCYKPNAVDNLHITPSDPVTFAPISVQGSPLTLIVNQSGSLTIRNDSLAIAATNIASNFTGTGLNGLVNETGNTCTLVAPQSTCTLTYTALNTTAPQTNFPIAGTNTNTITAAIKINTDATLTSISPTSGPTFGGTNFTLTGTALSGVTAVQFDGVPATNVMVVNSTTVTGITPAHAAGPATVTATANSSNVSLATPFTYILYTLGQNVGGGKVACLGGAPYFNLIVNSATAEVQTNWANTPASVNQGPAPQPSNDGLNNTNAIIATQPLPRDYAAAKCADYQIDSQGDTPCQVGRTCYDDWYLPATNQLACLYNSRNAVGGYFTGFSANYWTSTQFQGGIDTAYFIDFSNGLSAATFESEIFRVRCVRNLT